MAHEHHLHTDNCTWHTQAGTVSDSTHTHTHTHTHFAHSVWVWEFSIPERLRCRLKRMSSHTEGAPHEIESHVASFQPDYSVGPSTNRDPMNGRIQQREKPTGITCQNRQITVCCYSTLLWSFTSAELHLLCSVFMTKEMTHWYVLKYFLLETLFRTWCIVFKNNKRKENEKKKTTTKKQSDR